MKYFLPSLWRVLPCSFVIGTFLSRSATQAVFPSSTTIFGSMIENCLERCSRPWRMFSREGVPRKGRYLTGLVMKTSSSASPMSLMNSLRSLPDLPTKGRPVFASSLPGASPIKTISALGFPSPGTAFPVPHVLHTRHFSISSAIFRSLLFLCIVRRMPRACEAVLEHKPVIKGYSTSVIKLRVITLP